ncbi:hypothetical protein R3P38DRAFT_3361780 [Favolaschia claudopus]|uniref:Uncharacterized protein n=1 Tax=Favolaschia claudopus TaxID=2862362 RepID=A0AAW0AS19_9AGAR
MANFAVNLAAAAPLRYHSQRDRGPHILSIHSSPPECVYTRRTLRRKTGGGGGGRRGKRVWRNAARNRTSERANTSSNKKVKHLASRFVARQGPTDPIHEIAGEMVRRTSRRAPGRTDLKRHATPPTRAPLARPFVPDEGVRHKRDAEAVRKELPALKAGNIYVGQRSGLGTMLLDYTMRKRGMRGTRHGEETLIVCKNLADNKSKVHATSPSAHASRLGFLDTPDSFSLPPSALVEAVRSEESPARKAEMVGKAPQFTTSSHSPCIAPATWRRTSSRTTAFVSAPPQKPPLSLREIHSFRRAVRSSVGTRGSMDSVTGGKARGESYSMQLDGETSALPRLITTLSSKLSFASSSAIRAIYSKTIQLHLNVQRSPNLSSTESSASSIVEMCFSNDGCVHRRSNQKLNERQVGSAAWGTVHAVDEKVSPKVSAVRINPSGWSCCASLGRKQVVSVSRSTDNGPSPQRVPSKDVGEQPDAKRQRFLVEYSEASESASTLQIPLISAVCRQSQRFTSRAAASDSAPSHSIALQSKLFPFARETFEASATRIRNIHEESNLMSKGNGDPLTRSKTNKNGTGSLNLSHSVNPLYRWPPIPRNPPRTSSHFTGLGGHRYKQSLGKGPAAHGTENLGPPGIEFLNVSGVWRSTSRWRPPAAKPKAALGGHRQASEMVVEKRWSPRHGVRTVGVVLRHARRRSWRRLRTPQTSRQSVRLARDGT